MGGGGAANTEAGAWIIDVPLTLQEECCMNIIISCLLIVPMQGGRTQKMMRGWEPQGTEKVLPHAYTGALSGSQPCSHTHSNKGPLTAPCQRIQQAAARAVQSPLLAQVMLCMILVVSCRLLSGCRDKHTPSQQDSGGGGQPSKTHWDGTSRANGRQP